MSQTENPIEMPGIPGIEDAPVPVIGLTRHERYLTLQTESLAAFERAKNKYWGRGRWGVLDLPFDEMRNLGPRLSKDTVTIVKGYRDVEGYIPDFALSGFRKLRRVPSYRTIHSSWVGDEFMHGMTIDKMLEGSGIFNDNELYDQMEEALTEVWSPVQHPGLDSPAGFICFTTIQERATYFSYVRLIRHVRREYGYPEEVTGEEKERGMEVGISEGLRRISRDEIYHHGVFLEQLKLLRKYFPDHTLVKFAEVLDGFAMPAVQIIPGSREFLRALLRSKVYTRNTQEEEVFKPVLAALGFPDRDSFNQAVEQARENLGDEQNIGHRRLFPVPRILRRWEVKIIAEREWYKEREKNWPKNLETPKEHMVWAEEYERQHPRIIPQDLTLVGY